MSNKYKTIWDRTRQVTDLAANPSLTKSEYKDQCDINNVVQRALRTGVLPGTNLEPLYADFSEISDYATASIKIAEATQAFEQLPSNIKEQFDNDVNKLLDFVDDPENEEEAKQLGLLPQNIEAVSSLSEAATEVATDLTETTESETIQTEDNADS
jgi:phage internal scaffolding protein